MDDVSLWVREASESAAILGRPFSRVSTNPDRGDAPAIGRLADCAFAACRRHAAGTLAQPVSFERRLAPEHARHLHLSNTGVKLLGNVAFWVVMLIFVAAASRVLGMDVFTSWLDSIVGYLPTLFAGGLIILFGLLVSTLVRDLATAAAASAGFTQANLIGRLLQASILITTLVLGLGQIGVDVSLLITLIAILAAAISGSLALAFALGARSLVDNLIGAHYLQQIYRPGQHARMGDVEGEILELTPVSVVLATEQGRITVPAKVFNDQTTGLIAKAPQDE